MENRRTDLALEAKELYEESTEETTELSGVKAREEDIGPYHITHVEILDAQGEKALGKPCGKYVTLELDEVCTRGKSDYAHAAEILAGEIGKLLKVGEKGPVLVAGLGNRDMKIGRAHV